MKPSILLFLFALLILSCKQREPDKPPRLTEDIIHQETEQDQQSEYDFVMVFASCADQERPQPLWDPINELEPDLFVWGGDNVYADTEDMAKMEADYNKVKALPGYAQLMSDTKITGTWDDHDYGKNDAGTEYSMKKESQTLLLDFLDVPADDIRRSREGVYTSELYETGEGTINLILLDTRYFRDGLNPDDTPGRRYQDWPEDSNFTLLGEDQWKWLEQTLESSDADFNVIVSSIQFLSKEHGWEKWHNFPNEVNRLYELLARTSARNVMILSGDRHMAEISVNEDSGMGYPLVDFTTSGMTHTWIDGPTEGNEYRVSNVVKRLNFGALFFDFKNESVTFEIRGEEGFIYERFTQQY